MQSRSITDSVGFFLVGLIYIAILYVLVVNQNGAGLITAVTGGLANVISAATGGGTIGGSTAAPAPHAATTGPSTAGRTPAPAVNPGGVNAAPGTQVA